MDDTKYRDPITGELKNLKELKSIKDAMKSEGNRNRISLVFKKTGKRFF